MAITAEEVKNIRLALGISRKEFASRVGASRSSVDYWERGTITPGYKYARKIRSLLPKGAKDTGAAPPTEVVDTPAAVSVLEHAANFRKQRQVALLRDALQYVSYASGIREALVRENLTTFLVLIQDNQPLEVQDILDGLANVK